MFIRNGCIARFLQLENRATLGKIRADQSNCKTFTRSIGRKIIDPELGHPYRELCG